MATIHLTGATVSFNGVDLADYAMDIELPTEPAAEAAETSWATGRLAALRDASFTFSGHWDGPMPLLDLPVERTITVTLPAHVARAWLAYVRQLRRARIGRMHAAYRRRKRGRW